MPSATTTVSTPRLLPVVTPTTSDGEAHRAVVEVAGKLAEVEDLIAQAVRRFPDQKAVLRGVIAKMRSDLAFLEKKLGGAQAK